MNLKLLSCFASAALMLSTLTACNNSRSQTSNTVSTVSQTSNTASEQPQGSVPATSSEQEVSIENVPENESSDSDSRILIAYFTAAENSGVDAISSASYTQINGAAVGRIRAVADMIADNTGGELFSIRTETVYPTNGGDLIDFAAEEQGNNARPVLTSHIENLDDYDVIFVGYPNWWYDMPMALYSFFDEYDFSGKTIIPFNVHNGSRFSSTIFTIQNLEPAANVVTDGFTVSEHSVAEAADDVAEWLD
ncbi:MAG: flavodoxin [Oscillospiraceae bacterium]